MYTLLYFETLSLEPRKEKTVEGVMDRKKKICIRRFAEVYSQSSLCFSCFGIDEEHNNEGLIPERLAERSVIFLSTVDLLPVTRPPFFLLTRLVVSVIDPLGCHVHCVPEPLSDGTDLHTP